MLCGLCSEHVCACGWRLNAAAASRAIRGTLAGHESRSRRAFGRRPRGRHATAALPCGYKIN